MMFYQTLMMRISWLFVKLLYYLIPVLRVVFKIAFVLLIALLIVVAIAIIF